SLHPDYRPGHQHTGRHRGTGQASPAPYGAHGKRTAADRTAAGTIARHPPAAARTDAHPARTAPGAGQRGADRGVAQQTAGTARAAPRRDAQAHAGASPGPWGRARRRHLLTPGGTPPMRLFWEVFPVLWLAALLVRGYGFLISRALHQYWLLLPSHPQLGDVSSQLVGGYEEQGPAAAQQWLEQQLQQYRLRAVLFNDQGQRLLQGSLPTLPRREASDEASPPRPRYGRLFQLAWDSDQASYQLLLHIPGPELFRWQRTPFAMLTNITIAMLVLAALSLLLSRYLTAPLRQLGAAAEDLAEGRFDATALARTGRRRDEIGQLSRQFQNMADRVQSLLNSQTQLMRDISHELRSPLAR